MKKNSTKRIIIIASLSAITLSIFAGCQKKTDDTAASANPSQTAEASPESGGTVLVGTGAYPNPYTYQDDDGTIKGIDIDLLRAVFEGSSYDLEIEATEFASVLAGLDTDRYQIGANSFSKTAEREEKYLFSKPIYRNPLGVVVPIDSDIDSFDDLAGKVTSGEPSISYSVIIENYNKENPDNPITINYTEKDLVLQFQDVIDGVSDFKLESAITASIILKSSGLDKQLKVVELPADAVKSRSAYSYYIFPKTDEGEALRDFVNGRLAELRTDGTLQELYQTYFGGDYLPSDDEFNSK